MLTNESFKYLKYLKIKKPHSSENLRNLFDVFENNNYDYDEPEVSYVSIDIPEFNKYVAPNLLKKFENYKNTTLVKWQVKSSFNIDCNLYVHTKNKKINKKVLNLLVYIISFTASLSNKQRELDIHVVLLPDKKTFLKKFTTNEVNSGVTSYDDNSGTVLVYRREECIKVIIHEMIHALSFSDIDDTESVINHYNNKYNIDCTKINLNETYTEIWAKLINCYLVTKLNSKGKDKYYYFCYLIDCEKMFSSIQASKITKHLKKVNKKINLSEHTNVVAYYLAINELINNLDKFLKLKMRDNNLFYLQEQSKFDNLMLSFTNNDTRLIEKFNKIFNRTFRMTSVELKI
tara:strand:+ start:470 stop:1507 length:1038 start_codon:yes stop_codon:yes gene_type:complete